MSGPLQSRWETQEDTDPCPVRGETTRAVEVRGMHLWTHGGDRDGVQVYPERTRHHNPPTLVKDGLPGTTGGGPTPQEKESFFCRGTWP